jgi:hypothetical protein
MGRYLSLTVRKRFEQILAELGVFGVIFVV